MSLFLQIILINMAVSCDNIGVIALTTRRLTEKEAKLASRIGIGLSVVLKLVFIGVVGFLFSVPWLHIRIIGGLLLIYVVHNMLKESKSDISVGNTSKNGNDSFLFALVSIIATDISMSLDNVLAILSIVSADNTSLDANGFLLISASLLACVPILLWCSGAVSKLISRFPLLIYICAGYLFYTALNMVCEDELISLLLDSIRLTITTPIAVLAGIAVVLASVYINRVQSPAHVKTRKRLVSVYIIASLDALVTLGMMGYLSTNPVKNGIAFSVETFFQFGPCGANGLYTLARSPHLIALCTCLITVVIMGEENSYTLSSRTYLKKMGESIQTMILFILIDVTVATLGLTMMFGFGTLDPASWLGYLAMQIILYSSYISIFGMIKLLIKRKSIMIIVSMVAIHIEIELVELFMILGKWPFFTGYMPSRFIHSIPQPIQTIDPLLLLRVLLCVGVCIILSTYIGCMNCRSTSDKQTI